MPFYDLSPKKTVLRAEFSTNYEKSSEERKHNISLAVKSLNKTFIDAGGEFSFNRTVGERSERRGYLSAKIIVDGEFTDGVGGGVCQVSTTLYNALILADIPVIERHRHTLAVSYIEPSFDAMVSFGYADLKAKNVTRNPVIVYATADGKKITVRVYGEPLDCAVERKSVVTGEIPAPEEVIRADRIGDGFLYEGEKRVISYGKNGIESEGIVIKRKNGKVIEKKRIRKDAYAPVKRVVAIGTHPRENEESFSFIIPTRKNALTNA